MSTERFEMDNPSPFTLCRIPLEDEQISIFIIAQRMLLANTIHFQPISMSTTRTGRFLKVNKRFARAACAEAAEVPRWVHDYNLWLAPGYIRAERPDLKIAFPSSFPGMMFSPSFPGVSRSWKFVCCDVVGFHIPRYTENFARAAAPWWAPNGAKCRWTRSLRLEPPFQARSPCAERNGRTIQLLSSPVGTSPDLIQELCWSPSVESHGELIVQDTKGEN